jgi:hypothetical protein
MSENVKSNLNPHKAAVAAMWLWGEEYSAQRGGSMDFWKQLGPSRQDTARRLVKTIEAARKER